MRATYQRRKSTPVEPRDRVIDAGGDAIVVFWREIGRASHGHLEVETETAVMFKVRNRRIAEARGYLDRDEALRAAGLAG